MLKLTLQALWAGLLSLIGLQRKDPVQKIDRHDAQIAEKQTAIVADHTRPAADERLRQGDF